MFFCHGCHRSMRCIPTEVEMAKQQEYLFTRALTEPLLFFKKKKKTTTTTNKKQNNFKIGVPGQLQG